MLIEWSSNLNNRHINCRKGDPATHNITIGNAVEVDIFTAYYVADANGNTLLTCILTLLASELQMNACAASVTPERPFIISYL